MITVEVHCPVCGQWYDYMPTPERPATRLNIRAGESLRLLCPECGCETTYSIHFEATTTPDGLRIAMPDGAINHADGHEVGADNGGSHDQD